MHSKGKKSLNHDNPLLFLCWALKSPNEIIHACLVTGATPIQANIPLMMSALTNKFCPIFVKFNFFSRYHGLLPAQQIQNPSYEKPFYNPNKMAAYNDRTIQRSSMIYGTNRRSYPNPRQMPPPVPPPHADTAQMQRPPSEISEVNRQSHIYETPLFNSL